MKNFKITIFNDYNQLSQESAKYVFSRWQEKYPKKFVLGLATGKTQVGFRKNFLKLVSNRKPSLKNLYLFNLDEYWPIEKNHPCSYFWESNRNFWQPLLKLRLGFKQNHAFIPNGETENPRFEAANYEKTIKSVGGVDLQILGVGVEGHIGFNEKGSSADTTTRLVNLSDSTREANKAFFSQGKRAVPKQAITMGITTILKARKILLLISGRKKRMVFKRLIKSKQNKNLPVSFLKLHQDVTIFTDREASGKTIEEINLQSKFK